MKTTHNYRWLLVVYIIFGACFLLFFRLGGNYLVNFDEAFYAVMAKEMVRNGDVVTLSFGGERFFAASPFYIWLVASWFYLFGTSEFGVRFFAAASSLLTILTINLFFWKRKNFLAGIFASVVLLSTIKFLFLSRTGNVDATLALFTTTSLLFFYLGCKERKFLIYGGITSGLAFLTKGLFGLFPLITIAAYALLRHRSLFRAKFFWAALLAFLAVILPWQIALYLKYGHEFMGGFYGGYMATKVGPQSFISRLWWGSGLWQGMKLWLPIAVIATIVSLLNKRLRQESRFFILAILIYLGGLSFITTHNDWYLMPIYPLFAIIIGLSFQSILGLASIRLSKQYMLVLFATIALFQIIRYHSFFIVPQTTDAQVLMVKEAEKISSPSIPILLDDFYYPVAMHYSNRPIILLRGNRDRFTLIRGDTMNEYLAKGSPILSNTTTIESAQEASKYPLILEKTHGELLLYRGDPAHGKIRQ